MSTTLEAVKERLHLLSIFYFVMAGFLVLGVLGSAGMATIGASLSSMDLDTLTQPQPGMRGPPDEFIRVWKMQMKMLGAMYFYGGIIIALVEALLAALTVYAGLSLRKLENRTFVMVMAGVLCVIFPFGTILGIFSLIVLVKSEATSLFERNALDAP